MVDQAHLEGHSGGHGWSFSGELSQHAVDEVHNRDHFQDAAGRQDHYHDTEGRIHAIFHDRREEDDSPKGEPGLTSL